MGDTLYDPGMHVLWSNLTMNVASVGKVRGLVALRLTEYGYLQFMGYGLEQEFTQYEAMYRNMVHNISLNENDIYKPALTDNAPTLFGINLGQTAIAALIGALIGGLFGLFKMFTRKKS